MIDYSFALLHLLDSNESSNLPGSGSNKVMMDGTKASTRIDGLFPFQQDPFVFADQMQGLPARRLGVAPHRPTAFLHHQLTQSNK